MTHRATRARLAAVPLALAAAFPSHSQTTQASDDTRPRLREVVVTATRTPMRADEVIADVVVIDRPAIEQSTARTLPELLQRHAGLQIAASGGRGSLSNVFIRGSESRHAILLVDGVRYGSASAGTPIFDNLPIEQIERIEVLRGPASALYGADGVGGVIQVFTRRGKEGFHPYASASVGSERWREGTAGFSGAGGAWSYSLGLQAQRERGISATNANEPFGSFDPDRDGFRQRSVSGSLGLDINPDWRVDASLLRATGKVHFDDGPGVDSRATVRTLATQIGVKGRVLSGWQTELRFGRSEDTNNTQATFFPPPNTFKTTQNQWTLQNNVDTPLGLALLGAERREERVESNIAPPFPVRSRTINAVFAGLNGKHAAHSWQLNLRHDRNTQFGNATTGFVGYGYEFLPGLRGFGSYGTSFVAPSFNLLYFPFFSNPDLEPERGRNFDLGVSYKAAGHEVKLLHFENRVRDLIANDAFFIPQNAQRARIDGWTLSYTGRVARTVDLRASFDHLHPRNLDTGNQLARRAKNQASAGADWQLGDWRFGTSLLYVGKRFDNTANTVRLDSYFTADFSAEYRFARDWRLQAKLNNAFDKKYETAYGFNQPDRSAYLTLRWQPQ